MLPCQEKNIFKNFLKQWFLTLYKFHLAWYIGSRAEVLVISYALVCNECMRSFSGYVNWFLSNTKLSWDFYIDNGNAIVAFIIIDFGIELKENRMPEETWTRAEYSSFSDHWLWYVCRFSKALHKGHKMLMLQNWEISKEEKVFQSVIIFEVLQLLGKLDMVRTPLKVEVARDKKCGKISLINFNETLSKQKQPP